MFDGDSEHSTRNSTGIVAGLQEGILDEEYYRNRR